MTRTIRYRTRLFADKTGKRTACDIEQWVPSEGRWKPLGRSRFFHAYPASVRARDSGDRIVKRYHESAWPGCNMEIGYV